MDLDVVGNRKARKYSRHELLQRVLWGFSQPLFRFSPRHLYGWRTWLLRLFGASVGRHVRIYPNVRIFLPSLLKIDNEATIGWGVQLYNLGPLHIGPQVTISQGAHLCGGTHDDTDASLPLIRTSIRLEAACWICADAFIGPGVTVGAGAVVGARAVVMRDVPAWQVVAGNPARAIRTRVIKPAGLT